MIFNHRLTGELRVKYLGSIYILICRHIQLKITQVIRTQNHSPNELGPTAAHTFRFTSIDALSREIEGSHTPLDLYKLNRRELVNMPMASISDYIWPPDYYRVSISGLKL